jgi:hypothetical protein
MRQPAGSPVRRLAPTVHAAMLLVLAATLCCLPEAAAAPEVISASHRGALVGTALPFSTGDRWQFSSTEMLWNSVECSPIENFRIRASEAWIFYVVGGEIETTLRGNYKALHGAISVGAGGISVSDEGEQSEGWYFVTPTITYQGAGWDATIGYVFSSKPDLDIASTRSFTLLRAGLTHRLGLFLEGQYYSTECQSGDANCLRGYGLQALRYQAGDVSLDFGVSELFELEHKTGLSYDLGAVIPLPYIGVSVRI